MVGAGFFPSLVFILPFLDIELIFPRWGINRYVPNPSPSVFRTTKNNHNILQGVAAPDLRLTDDAKTQFDAWILKNGLRWTADGGPLAPGGVDVAFIGKYLFLACSALAHSSYR